MTAHVNPPALSELLEALPAGLDEPLAPSAHAELQRLLGELPTKPLPTGRISRLWSLGTLQAKVAAAYLAWWLRSGFQDADKKRRGLDETHVAAAIQVLGRMSYMRGAVMKLGQVIAHWPHVLPGSFAEILSRLYMDAPPMHFALLREHVQRELGAPPHELFDDFEETAFAAASLGQVHRARLKGSGRPVAVKIQYPDIGRTITNDIKNLKAVGFPMRLSGDWENLHSQYEGIERMLQQEIDYEAEANNARQARETLSGLDDIVVPEIIDELSTKRVLTMEYIEGLHLDRFMKTDPSDALRTQHGEQTVRAGMRLWYTGRMVYADPHPGNFLFMPDGRLGLIDFGCCHHFTDEEFAYVMEVERSAIEDDEEAFVRSIAAGCEMTVDELDAPRLALMREYCNWIWEPIQCGGPYDFGAPGQFERGVQLYGEFIKRRWTRSKPVNVWLTKVFFGERAMLTHLKARVDYHGLMREESRRAQ